MLAAVALAACTSAGGDASLSFASAMADPMLPETVDVTPFRASEDAEISASNNPPAAEQAVLIEPETATIEPAAFAKAETPAAPLPVASSSAGSTPVVVPGQKQQAAKVAPATQPSPVESAPEAKRSALDLLIARYATLYEVPEALVRRVVKRESNFNPRARNRAYWGLMQIRHDTARGMGYRGSAHGLLDAETNLKYAVKYLRGAYVTAGGDHDRAVRFYARGYYYDAKRRGLLDETGLGRDRKRRRGV